MARPWGGRVLADRYRKALPAGDAPLGETWEASDIEGAVSVVAEGRFAGQRIDEVLGRKLPFLLKFLDATETLSVQVHPDEQAASEIGGDARPKTEAWHILWTEPGAYIYFGAKPGVSTPQLLEACASGDPDRVESVLQRIPVAVGDTIFVPAGTVHAIGAGVCLYEIQQPSDSTYRLYDWGRLGLDGFPRPVHHDQAKIAIRGPTRGDPRRETELVPGANPRIMLCRCPLFRLDLILCDIGELIIPESRHVTFVTAVGGDGVIKAEDGDLPILPGDTFCIPHEVDWMVKPGKRGLRLLHARVPKQSSFT